MSENAKNHTKEQDKATARPWKLRIERKFFDGQIMSENPLKPVPVCDIGLAYWANLRAATARGLSDGEIDSVIEEKLANAALIVKAVNSHDTLVELVEDLREYFADCADASAEGDPLEFKPNQEMTILEKIESALKLAKGEEKS